jgi:quinol monooxygenase YgiN
VIDSIYELEGEITHTDIHWMVELEIKPGQEENLRTLVAEMVAEVQAKESGALDYEYNISQDGKVCHLFERYTDIAATIAHLERFTQVFAERFLKVFQPIRFSVYGLPSKKVREVLAGFNPVYMETVGGFRR